MIESGPIPSTSNDKVKEMSFEAAWLLLRFTGISGWSLNHTKVWKIGWVLSFLLLFWGISNYYDSWTLPRSDVNLLINLIKKLSTTKIKWNKKRKTKKRKWISEQFQLFFRKNSKRIKCKERSISIGLIVKIVPEVKS